MSSPEHYDVDFMREVLRSMIAIAMLMALTGAFIILWSAL